MLWLVNSIKNPIMAATPDQGPDISYRFKKNLTETSQRFLNDAVGESTESIAVGEKNGRTVLSSAERGTSVALDMSESVQAGRPTAEGAVRLIEEMPPGARGILALKPDGGSELTLIAPSLDEGTRHELELAAWRTGAADVKETSIPTTRGDLLPVVKGRFARRA